jgi:hypothetical protein
MVLANLNNPAGERPLLTRPELMLIERLLKLLRWSGGGRSPKQLIIRVAPERKARSCSVTERRKRFALRGGG